MKREDVPQDAARALQGQRKAMYAIDEHGDYAIVRSAGWEAEEIVLDQAISEFEEQARDALSRARRGLTSPLEFHMLNCRMDVLVLAQSSGYFQWQVRRHLRPQTFKRLSSAQLGRYASALGMSIERLTALPDAP